MTLQWQNLARHLKEFIFEEKGNYTLFPSDSATVVEKVMIGGIPTTRYINEFWTSRQRQSSSIHEISYRACFKAQLPRFFIELLTKPGDTVYDPFSGRGTTVIEAATLGRFVISNDINPLSRIIVRPRLSIPGIEQVFSRLESIPVDRSLKADLDLSMFYHPITEAEIVSIKRHLENRKLQGAEDDADRWIRMVATNRLTGHSPGFFSVYTLPPNQAVSPESQIKINRKRNQAPEYRDTKIIIKRKTASLFRDLSPAVTSHLRKSSGQALFLECDAGETGDIESNSVDLAVTSPPFLDVVQYSRDNWLRCWFNDIDTAAIENKITMSRTPEVWSAVMGRVFKELYRVTRPGGWLAFEVGEIRKGKVKLEEHVVPLGVDAGFECFGVIINKQRFTKTSNIWGVKNNSSGTNTNRIALFYKNL